MIPKSKGPGRTLTYDIAIYDNDGKLIGIVEIDGPHHFKVMYLGGSKTADSKVKAQRKFEGVIARDLIKEARTRKWGVWQIRLPWSELSVAQAKVLDWTIAEMRVEIAVPARGVVIYYPHPSYTMGRFTAEHPGNCFVPAPRVGPQHVPTPTVMVMLSAAALTATRNLSSSMDA
jgi:hypothetical protein